MSIRRYSTKEQEIFLWVIIPYVLVLNTIVFGTCIFGMAYPFALSLVLSTVYLFAFYFLCGLVAVMIQKRFPTNQDVFRRISFMLPAFYLMNTLMVTGLYGIYGKLVDVGCPPLTANFFWALGFSCVASTLITFLNEAAVNWNNWKKAITETEQLKNAYQKTRLFGLKGQVNPHFLFNCFNSLSSLIHDDAEKAEKFLDEMTKVHRYMLRGEEEQLVPLSEEIRYARSYMYLTKSRFGDAVRFDIQVDPDDERLYLPPLTLQAVMENIIYTNSASKSAPLRLSIRREGEYLGIVNTVQSRMSAATSAYEDELDNLVNKYRLLNAPEIRFMEDGPERKILIPLFKQREAGL
jgi:sensor histidine kinase YesM